MSLSVFLCQSLYAHLVPTITRHIYQPVIYPSLFPSIHFPFCLLVLPFVYLPLLHPSLLISPLDVCLLSPLSINHSLCLVCNPETRIRMVHFHFSPRWLSKMKLQKKWTRHFRFTENHYRRINKRCRLNLFLDNQQSSSLVKKRRYKKKWYLECWRGCQWRSSHSTPRRGRRGGHRCPRPRSHTETDREDQCEKLLIYNGFNANSRIWDIVSFA